LSPAERSLAHLLADRYPSHPSTRRLLDAAGIPPRFVSFSDRPVDTWFDAVVQAKDRRKIGALVTAARDDYPDDPLLAAVDQLTPPIPHESLDRFVPEIPADRIQAEILRDRSELLPVSFLATGASLARSVGKIETSSGTATGFLVADNLLVTNNHVLPSAAAARAARLILGYEDTGSGTLANTVTVRFAPQRYFETSPQMRHDWTVVAVDASVNDEFGAIPLEPSRQHEHGYVTLIHHPYGWVKQISLRHNAVVGSTGERLHYLTGTDTGSSGAPVFNSAWRLVALHRGSAEGAGRVDQPLHSIGTRIEIVAARIR
jgi:S1-C subfamily serine protease